MRTGRIRAQEEPPVCVAGWLERALQRQEGQGSRAAANASGRGPLWAWSGANLDLIGLVELVVARAREAREDLARALRLARALDIAAAGGSRCAEKFAGPLKALSDDLAARTRWGEHSLFPRLLGLGAGGGAFRERLCERQARASVLLDTLSKVVRDREGSVGLCVASRELLWACQKAEWSLREHPRLEVRLLDAASPARADGGASHPAPLAGAAAILQAR